MKRLYVEYKSQLKAAPEFHLQQVKVTHIQNFRGRDPAHEEDGP